MSISRAAKIAFLPPVGTAIYLGIIVVMAIVQFGTIESTAPSQVVAYVFGYFAFALSLKLILSAVFGLFVGKSHVVLPRKAMLLLAVILMIVGMFLLMPFLVEYVV